MAKTLSPKSMPRRNPSISIEELAAAKAKEVVLRGSSVHPTDAPHSMQLTARLIEGHPDDIPGLRAALIDPLVRAALMADLERDDDAVAASIEEDEDIPIIGNAIIKILSALYAAKATDFDGFLILAFKPITTHRNIFRSAQSAHQKMQVHALDPDLDAILARPWQAPFHGHAHCWSKLSWQMRRFLLGTGGH